MFIPGNQFGVLGVPTQGLPVGSQLPSQQVAQPEQQVAMAPPEAGFDRSINYLADYSGCGHWRMIWPSHLLNAHQKAVIHSTTMMVLDERYYDNTLCVRVQRQATEHQLNFIKLLKEFANRKGFRIVYEIDDIVFKEDIPDYNKFKPAFTDPKIRECALEIMQTVDEITCTCKFMQEYYKSKTGNNNITVIPNYPPKWWMGNFYREGDVLKNYKRTRKRPRIVYSASGAHFDVDNKVGQRDDFYHVVNVITKTLHEFQWVFLGAYPLQLHPYVEQGLIEFHPWQRLYEYPALLQKVNPTMFIAPLQDNTFNKAKSDLKYIEACCFGIPIVCQDLCTYENAPFKFTTGDELVDQLKRITKSFSAYKKYSEAGREVAESRWLEHDSNIDKYMELYKYPYKSPERKLINSLAENK
tara:strand:+ start:8416 stop:9651 length:1236 start_codon:yes stop_codon:yes gene_type:complete